MSSRFVSKGLCVAVAGLIALAGCGGLWGGQMSGKRAIDSARGADPSVTPFRLDVLDEAEDGEQLTIKGRLIPKSDWPAEDVLVRLAAADSNGEERVSYHRFTDLNPTSQELKAGVPSLFSLSLPAPGLSNYQLGVLWGKDAEPYRETPKASMKAPESPKQYLALRSLEVHRIPDGSCATPEECLVKFAIRGEFFNGGGATIRDVVLVAGFSPADKLDLPDQILENERRIEVKNLGLAAGAAKPFRLTLEKYVPATDQVAYQPVVRIVSFDTEQQ